MTTRFIKGASDKILILAVGIISSVATTAGQWVVTNVLESPGQQAASLGVLDTRVTVLETKETAQDRLNTNLSNKTEWIVNTLYKFANRLETPVEPPPINK